MGYTDGLGRWVHMQVKGESLTRERTNEVMMRTNDWQSTWCNDKEWEHVVASVLGWYDQHDTVCDDEDCFQWWAWVRERRAIAEDYGRSIGAVPLHCLENEAVMSCSFDPGGWLSWDGTVRGDWTVGEYPTIKQLHADLEAIAGAFPFLRMEAQALSSGYPSEGVVEPRGTVVAHWRIRDGRVERQERPGPRFFSDSWADRWSDRLRYSRPGRAWRHRRARSVRVYPAAPFSWWEPHGERRVSAARLIEAADQMQFSTRRERRTHEPR